VRWRVDPRPWVAHCTAAVVALLIFAPIFYMALDREPPVTRLFGSMVPDVVVQGGETAVRYTTTRRNRQDCPGVVQQEIIDSLNTIYSKLARQTGPAKWEDDPYVPDREIFYGHPVAIPLQAAPGPAIFRTVTFRYCNPLQRWLHWPIIQVGPDLPFTIVAKPGVSK